MTLHEVDDDDFLAPIIEKKNEEPDFVTDLLHSRGISDPTKILFEDDNNQLYTKSWDELTREELLNIINTPLETQAPPTNEEPLLTNEEILFLNQLREARLTPQQYIESLQQPIEPTYKVDSLSDDELYILALEARVGELNEDQAAQALATAKLNEDLFNKQVAGIRKEFKEREDYESEQEQAQLEYQQQQAFESWRDSIVNAIDGFSSIGNLDLTMKDEDKEELAEFMLSQDESGNNYLAQALQDPETMVKAAWFILKGDEALTSIEDFYRNLIKLAAQQNYKRGLEERGNGAKPSVVITPQHKKNVFSSSDKVTLDDLYDDED